MSKKVDIVVVGGGHAGAEAAWAAACMGSRVALVTMQPEAIGRMSCNPAIGGLGKGQIVREIDALGGIMGLATDRAGIQFRMLNRSKGPAVWAPRAQCDRDAYPRAVQEILATNRNITIVEGSAERLETRHEGTEVRATKAEARTRHEGDVSNCQITTLPNCQISGVTLADGRTIQCDAVILTTGTFLRGLMHCGEQKSEGGRIGEALKDVSREGRQALVITHLPQIAVYADQHLVVAKGRKGGIATSDVAVVAGESRVKEIARMLGDPDMATAQRHAVELLRTASATSASQPETLSTPAPTHRRR